MEKDIISKRTFGILAARAGTLGTLLIGISFAINPGPPANSSLDQLISFGQQHSTLILWGAWLQAVGPLLIIFFALSLVCLAGATNKIAGWMTMFGAGVLMMVSLSEVVFYMAALNTNIPQMALISTDIAHAIQHLYFIVAAPALFLPLGVVILTAAVLPRVFAYTSFAFGLAFFVMGITSLQTLVLPNAVTALGALQAIWWLAAGITLSRSSRKLIV